MTHLIGRAIIQKDFANAVKLLLSFTSEYDNAENTKLREIMSDVSKYPEALKTIPKNIETQEEEKKIFNKDEIVNDQADNDSAVQSEPLILNEEEEPLILNED